jgi:AraC-like DNA-binding protein
MTRTTIPRRFLRSTYMPHNMDVIAEQDDPVNQTVEVHWHDFHKLVSVISGSGIHVLNGVPHEITPGITFLLAPSDFHAWLPNGDGCALYNIDFMPQVLAPYLQSALYDAARLRQGPLVVRDMTDLGPIMRATLTECGRLARPDAQLSVVCLLQYLLVEFIRRADVAESLDSKSASGMHEGVRWALTYMEQHYRDPLTLKDVAAEASLSPSYFSQLFHEFMGVTFQEHLQMLRAAFAASLLRATDMSVTDICHGSGFSDLSHFERAFKGRYGMPPSAWRRAVRQGEDLALHGVGA